MLHGTIRNDVILRNTALQCWNNVATIWINVAPMLLSSLAYPYFELNIEQDRIRKSLWNKQKKNE